MYLKLKQKKIVIHASTHNHYAEADRIQQQSLDNDDNIKLLHIQGKCLITHGEHGTLRIDSTHVIKYTQQEIDPISNSYQNVYD